jgi:hypothetical protein
MYPYLLRDMSSVGGPCCSSTGAGPLDAGVGVAGEAELDFWA